MKCLATWDAVGETGVTVGDMGAAVGDLGDMTGDIKLLVTRDSC